MVVLRGLYQLKTNEQFITNFGFVVAGFYSSILYCLFPHSDFYDHTVFCANKKIHQYYHLIRSEVAWKISEKKKNIYVQCCEISKGTYENKILWIAPLETNTVHTFFCNTVQSMLDTFYFKHFDFKDESKLFHKELELKTSMYKE